MITAPQPGRPVIPVDVLRGRPADLPLIRQDLLERILQLRASAAPPGEIQAVIDDYHAYTALQARS
jgi:hypothetical protein